MAFPAGDRGERITLQRMNAADAWEDYATSDWPATISAAVDAQGDESYRIRIIARPDLFGYQDTEPAMRVLWKDRTLYVRDVIEVDRSEVVLIAVGRQIPVEDLATGPTRKFPA